MPDPADPKAPASSASEDPLFSVAKVSMAIVILTGVITGFIFKDLAGEQAALIAFCLALAYSIFYMIYEKRHRTDGPKAWVGSIISATSIFVACAGINSSITSVVGGSGSSLAGIVKPWFTPVQTKQTLNETRAELKTSQDSVRTITVANTEIADRVASNFVLPSTDGSGSTAVSDSTESHSPLADSILVAQTVERAEQLMKGGTAEVQVRLPAADGKVRYQTVTAASKTELAEKINFYVRNEKGWYLVTATSDTENSPVFRREFERVKNVIKVNAKDIIEKTGVRPVPVIWPPASKEDPHYKVVAMYGLKSEQDARVAQRILASAGITDTKIYIR